jgi:putrescine transport system permease protein
VLPLYANLIKHDQRLLEAAYDLGAKPFKAFFQVTVPLSFAGIVAGCMLVFIPAVGEFVIPELLGGPSTKMIGKVLWEEYFTANDWPRASAIAIVMLMLLVIPITIFHRYQSRQLEARLS